MERESMVFYRSFYEAIAELPDEELAKAFRAIAEYGLNGVEVECGGSAKVALKMAKPQIDKNNARYKNGQSGGKKTAEPNPNQTVTKANQTVTKANQTGTKLEPTVTKPEPNVTKPEPNVNVNDNVIKKKDTSVSKEKARFAPPTLENVIGYCREKGLNVDAQRFIDYYESVGWKVGKTRKPMKDWKAAVRNWDRQDRAEDKPFKTRFHNHEQQTYDFDSLNLFVNE